MIENNLRLIRRLLEALKIKTEFEEWKGKRRLKSRNRQRATDFCVVSLQRNPFPPLPFFLPWLPHSWIYSYARAPVCLYVGLSVCRLAAELEGPETGWSWKCNFLPLFIPDWHNGRRRPAVAARGENKAERRRRKGRCSRRGRYSRAL